MAYTSQNTFISSNTTVTSDHAVQQTVLQFLTRIWTSDSYVRTHIRSKCHKNEVTRFKQVATVL